MYRKRAEVRFLKTTYIYIALLLFSAREINQSHEERKREEKKKRKRKRKLTSSLRQNAQMDLGLAAFTGVPLGLTLARVPAASAFFCSRWMRSFLEMGIFSFGFDGGGWGEEMRRFLGESQTMVMVVCDEGRAEADCVQCSRYR